VAKAPNMNNLVFTSIPNGSDIAVEWSSLYDFARHGSVKCL
jgi:hypothetical protein